MAPEPPRRSAPPPPRPARAAAAGKGAPVSGSRPKGRNGFLRLALWLINIGILAAVAVVVFNREGEDVVGQGNGNGEPAPAAPTPTPAKPAKPVPAALMPVPPRPAPATNNPPTMAGSTNMAGMMPAGGFSTNNFRVAGLTIERPRGTKGSRLTYVTGMLQDLSGNKRFGVRVDLNLLDRSGAKVGLATDYTAVIEPMGLWRFRALVLDRRAATAGLAAIRED